MEIPSKDEDCASGISGRTCTAPAAGEEQGTARAGISSTILWDWGHPLLVPTFSQGCLLLSPCAPFAGCTSGSINVHPTALGMDLFKTLEAPKSHLWLLLGLIPRE